MFSNEMGCKVRVLEGEKLFFTLASCTSYDTLHAWFAAVALHGCAGRR